MRLSHWLRSLTARPNRTAARHAPRRLASRPRLEALEDRCVPSVTINEFPLPASAPDLIRAGPDGNVWFTVNGGLGRITPAGQITVLPLGRNVDGFAFGNDGNIWFGGGTDIGEVTSQGVLLHDYQIPSTYNVQYPALSIALGPDGNIWYTEYGSNRNGPNVIGQLTPAGQITEFPIPFPAVEIITGPDGNLWFDGVVENAIGRVTPAGDVTIFSDPNSIPALGGHIRGLTSGPNGNLWMESEASNTIVEMSTAGQLVATFSDPDSPYIMTPGPDGNIWFTENGYPLSADGGNHIGSITPQGGITEYPIPTLNSGASGITAGPDGNIWFTEFTANQIGEVVLNQPTTTTVVSSPVNPSLFSQAVNFTATVSAVSPGLPTPTGSVDFVDMTTNTDLGAVSLSGGSASMTTSALTVGSHVIEAFYEGSSTLLPSNGSVTQVVIPPATLSGLVFEDFNDDGQVDFGEQGISGVTITLTGTDDLGRSVNLSQQTDSAGTYLFANLRPGQYYLTETQPAGYLQGIDSVGTAGGSLADVDQFFVQLGQGVNGINYNYGEQPPAGGAVHPGQTAGIGFWQNKNGQNLILALNGGAASTQLANWLAVTLPNMYGAQAGAHSLVHQDGSYFSNAEAATFFRGLFNQKGPKLDAQVLATALSVYVTNATLDPTQAATGYGFKVSGDGVGTATVNVGSDGAAFGVANSTTLTVMDLLLATNKQAVNGLLYGGDSTLRNEANDIFSDVNEAGDIS